MKTLAKHSLSLTVLLLAVSAFAGSPQLCSVGYQDSTCVPALVRSADPQPMCSTGPGWTTVTASTWIGSRWTDPACRYQAPPTCQAGYTQIIAPSWTGSSWVGLNCAPPPPPSAPGAPSGGVPSPVNVIILRWFPMYGNAWYDEGNATATKYTMPDGSVLWSTLVTGGTWGIGTDKPWKAYPTHQTLAGLPMMAVDMMCEGTASYNGENGPVPQMITGGLIMDPAGYGYVTDQSQCYTDTFVP